MSTLWERTPPEARRIIARRDPELADMLRSLEQGDPYRRPSRPIMVARVSLAMDREGVGITKAVQIVATELAVGTNTVWEALHAARGGKKRTPLPRD